MGSLDSLLDTMTNVVGVLIVVLIVTQVNVSSAAKRIRRGGPMLRHLRISAARLQLGGLPRRLDQNSASQRSRDATPNLPAQLGGPVVPSRWVFGPSL